MPTTSTKKRRSTAGTRKKSAASAKKTAPRKKTATRAKTTRKAAGSRKKTTERKYGPGVGESVREEMEEVKAGTARSGRSGKKVTSREQAIAIGLSKARKKGEKVPPNPNE